MATGIPIPRSGSRSFLVGSAERDALLTPGSASSRGGAAGVTSMLAATDEGIQMLREMQGHNTVLRRELMGAGYAIDRLVSTVSEPMMILFLQGGLHV